MELFTTTRDEAAAEKVWTEEGFHGVETIGLNTGGAFGAAKQWPVEYFAELARQLVDRRGSAVLVLCGPNEREVAQQIVERANRSRVVSLARRDVSLGLTKACIRRLDLLVTTDSGPRHFAAAFNRPVVTLFGPTFIDWTETFYSKAENLQEKVPCGPCQKRECPLDHRCMRDLLVARVWQASVSLLQRFATLAGGQRHAS
jgi:heptosyltransferase-2